MALAKVGLLKPVLPSIVAAAACAICPGVALGLMAMATLRPTTAGDVSVNEVSLAATAVGAVINTEKPLAVARPGVLKPAAPDTVMAAACASWKALSESLTIVLDAQ